MHEELNVMRRRIRELEPLASLWDTYKSDMFKICSELHKEYVTQYEAILNGARNGTEFKSSLAKMLKGVRECK